MNKTFNFHPHVLIIKHFETIVNEIDLRTEYLLKDNILSEEFQKECHVFQLKQIDTIKAVQNLNLKSFEIFNEKEYFEKFSHLIGQDLVKVFESKEKNQDVYDKLYASFYEQCEKIEEEINKEIILIDCVLFEQPKSLNGLELWIMPWFCNAENLEFLK
jgi:hypothetical protein